MESTFQWASEEEMMAKITAGIALKRKSEMTEDYCEELLFLTRVQFASELIGAIGYQNMPTIATALFYDPQETAAVTQIFADEHLHAARLSSILKGLDFDVKPWVEEHHAELTFRLPFGRELEPREIPTTDMRLNIFYYPLDVEDIWDSWINLSLFQFLQDRGAGEQLRDAESASYQPWALAVRKIQEEELMHIAHGDKTLRKLMGDPLRRERAQELFEMWWPRVVRTFGRSGSTRNAKWRRYGLKHRTNEQTFKAFLEAIHKANQNIGLHIPSIEESMQHFMRR